MGCYRLVRNLEKGPGLSESKGDHRVAWLGTARNVGGELWRKTASGSGTTQPGMNDECLFLLKDDSTLAKREKCPLVSCRNLSKKWNEQGHFLTPCVRACLAACRRARALTHTLACVHTHMNSFASSCVMSGR